MRDLSDPLGAATNTLICAPSMSGHAGGGEGCTELLHAGDTTPDVLWVTYTRSPSACVEAVRSSSADVGALSVIAVGETPTAEDTSRSSVTVDSISTPSDLTGLGITLSQTLSDHEDVVVCFDSLTAMLQYVEVETSYEFLHTVTGQLHAADARAHFHLDPTAHDRQTVDALASLFDAVVHVRDGERHVRTRELLRT
jgi:KaiC/GvpD/RAD55 family RecA-like ATPase